VSRFDIDEVILWILAVLVVGLLGIVAWATLWTTTNCKATDDTRLSNRLVPAGKVVIPTTVQERRFICPGGEEVWL
jgi:hypothetical protein